LVEFEIAKVEVKTLVINTPDDVEKATKLKKRFQKARTGMEKACKDVIKPFKDKIESLKKEVDAIVDDISSYEKMVEDKILEYTAKEAKLAREKQDRTQVIIDAIKTLKTEQEIANFKHEGDVDEVLIGKQKELQVLSIKQAELDEANSKLVEEQNKIAQLQNSSNPMADIEIEKIQLAQLQRETQNKEIELLKQQVNNIQTPTTQATKPAGLRTYIKWEVVDPNLVPREFCSPDEKLINEAKNNGVREIQGIRFYEEQKIV